MHRSQALIYRAEQRALQRRLAAARLVDPGHEMTERDAEKLSNVNTFLAKATASVLDLEVAREKTRLATDTDTLIEQLRYEFTLAARSFTDDEITILARNLKPEAFSVIDRVRAERFGAGEWKEAA